MKLFRKTNKVTTLRVVNIKGKAYDYPLDIPIPRIGEIVSVDNSPFGKVEGITYQVDESFRMTTIYTTEDC